MNSHDSRRNGRTEIAGRTVEVATLDGLVWTAEQVDEAVDGAGIQAREALPLMLGQLVAITYHNKRRYAVVRSAGWVDGQFRVSLQWNAAYFRDRAREVAAQHVDGESNVQGFVGSLPAAMYSLWNALDVRNGLVFTDAIVRFTKAAGRAEIDLSQERESALQAADGWDSQVDALEKLCKACLTKLKERDKDVEEERAPTVVSLPEANCLGAPAWVVGTAACLAGHVMLIL